MFYLCLQCFSIESSQQIWQTMELKSIHMIREWQTVKLKENRWLFCGTWMISRSAMRTARLFDDFIEWIKPPIEWLEKWTCEKVKSMVKNFPRWGVDWCQGYIFMEWKTIQGEWDQLKFTCQESWTIPYNICTRFTSLQLWITRFKHSHGSK